MFPNNQENSIRKIIREFADYSKGEWICKEPSLKLGLIKSISQNSHTKVNFTPEISCLNDYMMSGVKQLEQYHIDRALLNLIELVGKSDFKEIIPQELKNICSFVEFIHSVRSSLSSLWVHRSSAFVYFCLINIGKTDDSLEQYLEFYQCPNAWTRIAS